MVNNMANTREHINKYFAERLTPENSALLLIDHQTGLALGVKTMNPETFRNNVIAIAKVGKLFDLPTILTTSADFGPNGPLLPELTKIFPDVEVIRRKGEINAWDDPKFKAAVEAAGKKKLIIAGISTDVCLLFPVLSAIMILSASPSKDRPISAPVFLISAAIFSGYVEPQFLLIFRPSGLLPVTKTSAPSSFKTAGAIL